MKTFHGKKFFKEDKEEDGKVKSTSQNETETIEVEVQVIKEQEDDENKKSFENNVDDKKDESIMIMVDEQEEKVFENEEEIELEMKDHIEGLELAETAAIFSQETKENEKTAVKPDKQFFLTTMTGLELQ